MPSLGHQLGGGQRIEGIPDARREPPAGLEGSHAFDHEANRVPSSRPDTGLIMQINHWLIRELHLCCCCFYLLLSSQTQNLLNSSDQDTAFLILGGNVPGQATWSDLPTLLSDQARRGSAGATPLGTLPDPCRGHNPALPQPLLRRPAPRVIAFN